MTPDVVQFLILALSAAFSSTTKISLAWIMSDRMIRDLGDLSKKWPIGPTDPWPSDPLPALAHKLTAVKRDVTTVVSDQRSRFTAPSIDDYNITGSSGHTRAFNQNDR